MDALIATSNDFFLFRGDFGKLCTVWCAGYCLSIALAVRGSNGKANARASSRPHLSLLLLS